MRKQDIRDVFAKKLVEEMIFEAYDFPKHTVKPGKLRNLNQKIKIRKKYETRKGNGRKRKSVHC